MELQVMRTSSFCDAGHQDTFGVEHLKTEEHSNF